MPRPTTAGITRALASAALLALLPVASARATVAVRTSVEELARSSDAVVRGEVLQVSSHRAGSRIFTEVRLRVSAVWRGAAPGEVTIRTPGGVVDGIGQRVDGAPVFTKGEQAAVFLAADGTGRFRVTGLAQGKFSLRGADAIPDLRHVGFAGERVPPGERAAEPMAAAELERRVKGAK